MYRLRYDTSPIAAMSVRDVEGDDCCCQANSEEGARRHRLAKKSLDHS
jgi:hypothetical protein